jgi:hypothetical protein
MITSFLKKAIGALSPATLEVLRAINSRRKSARLERQIGATTAAQKIGAAVGMEVQTGPFQGMRFPESLRERGIGSKLLGTYERELHDCVSDAIAASPERVVIVGSAEGYYAVGLARAIPGAEVTAFDIDPWARARCGELARINAVEARVATRSFCGEKDMLALRGIRALVLSDCEGFEYRLFTPQVIEALGKSSIIIETHPQGTGGDNAALARAFQATHSVRMIPFTGREQLRREELAAYLSASEFSRAVDEYRLPDQEWLCATPLPPRA